MKKPSQHTDESVPQSVTEFIKVQTSSETIQIGFTDQKVSAHAGLATFAGFLHWHRLGPLLAQCLPQRRQRRDAMAPADLALGFMAGLLAGAKKLVQISFLRRDPLLPQLLANPLHRQSVHLDAFQGFTTAGRNLAAFRALWRFGLERLAGRPGGYTLDLDSTKLLHEDSRQEGVRTAPTAQGFRRCLHPLLAVIAEAKLVAAFWLRPGHAQCDNNVIAFTLDLLANLPRYVRVRLVRADSGFCHNPWLELLEQRRLPYIVVARLYGPLQRLLKKDTIWAPKWPK